MSVLARDMLFHLDVQAMCREGLGIEPDDWQARLIESTAPRLLVNVSRQAGKSTATAVIATQVAALNPGQTVLAVAPTERQARLLYDKISEFIARLGASAPGVDVRTLTTLKLRNGSQVLALPGTAANIRGYSANLVIVDEAAFVADDVFAAVGPTVAATAGRLILLSTPNGRRGFFFEAWQNGTGWERHRVTALQCPRLASRPDFLAQEERDRGPLLYRQEYLCEFVSDGESVFASEIIERCVSDDVLPLWPERR